MHMMSARTAEGSFIIFIFPITALPLRAINLAGVPEVPGRAHAQVDLRSVGARGVLVGVLHASAKDCKKLQSSSIVISSPYSLEQLRLQ